MKLKDKTLGKPHSVWCNRLFKQNHTEQKSVEQESESLFSEDTLLLSDSFSPTTPLPYSTVTLLARFLG